MFHRMVRCAVVVFALTAHTDEVEYFQHEVTVLVHNEARQHADQRQAEVLDTLHTVSMGQGREDIGIWCATGGKGGRRANNWYLKQPTIVASD